LKRPIGLAQLGLNRARAGAAPVPAAEHPVNPSGQIGAQGPAADRSGKWTYTVARRVGFRPAEELARIAVRSNPRTDFRLSGLQMSRASNSAR